MWLLWLHYWVFCGCQRLRKVINRTLLAINADMHPHQINAIKVDADILASIGHKTPFPRVKCERYYIWGSIWALRNTICTFYLTFVFSRIAIKMTITGWQGDIFHHRKDYQHYTYISFYGCLAVLATKSDTWIGD